MSAHKEAIEGVEAVSGTEKKNPASLEAQDLQPEVVEQPNKEKFENLMTEQTQKVAPIEANKVEATRVSLMDEVNKLNVKVDGLKGASPDEFVNKAKEVTGQMEDLKSKLTSATNLPEGASQDVLKNKLSHIDESLKVSLDRAGVEYTPDAKAAGQTPLEKFLTLLTDGQSRLESISSDVQTLQLNKQELSPATMLSLQIKVGFIQQEIELFTSLLSKAIESTKTIMNVQV